jgi:hypothetical protein
LVSLSVRITASTVEVGCVSVGSALACIIASHVLPDAAEQPPESCFVSVGHPGADARVDALGGRAKVSVQPAARQREHRTPVRRCDCTSPSARRRGLTAILLETSPLGRFTGARSPTGACWGYDAGRDRLGREDQPCV